MVMVASGACAKNHRVLAGVSAPNASFLNMRPGLSQVKPGKKRPFSVAHTTESREAFRFLGSVRGQPGGRKGRGSDARATTSAGVSNRLSVRRRGRRVARGISRDRLGRGPLPAGQARAP